MKTMEFKVLDVGCGENPKGDVNVDIFNPKLGTAQIRDQQRIYFVDANKIPNFIRCDAQYLPFKDGSFKRVRSFHTIEHVENPLLMLRELIRVSNGKVEIRCPHKRSYWAKMPFHFHVFDEKWFINSLESLNPFYSINYSVSISSYDESPCKLVDMTARDLRYSTSWIYGHLRWLYYKLGIASCIARCHLKPKEIKVMVEKVRK